jgi:hypothetical protein
MPLLKSLEYPTIKEPGLWYNWRDGEGSCLLIALFSDFTAAMIIYMSLVALDKSQLMKSLARCPIDLTSIHGRPSLVYLVVLMSILAFFSGQP